MKKVGIISRYGRSERTGNQFNNPLKTRFFRNKYLLFFPSPAGVAALGGMKRKEIIISACRIPRHRWRNVQQSYCERKPLDFLSERRLECMESKLELRQRDSEPNEQRPHVRIFGALSTELILKRGVYSRLFSCFARHGGPIIVGSVCCVL